MLALLVLNLMPVSSLPLLPVKPGPQKTGLVHDRGRGADKQELDAIQGSRSCVLMP